MATKDDILGILESRFDYYSAQVLYKGALKGAGLDDKKEYSDEEAASFAGALKEYDGSAEPLAAEVEELAGGAKAAPKKAASKKSDDKSDDKKDDKKDDDKKDDDKKDDDKKDDEKDKKKGKSKSKKK